MVHCLSTFVWRPSPTVAMSRGAASMDRGKSSATVTATASTGHSTQAKSSV
jgi:hypothetical protein